jgi:alkylated DNA repair dioxygenase AlkB
VNPEARRCASCYDPRVIGSRRIDLCDGAWLDFWPRVIDDDDAWLARLRGELALTAEQFRMMGRLVTSPRLVSFHGDPGTDYLYSGMRHDPAPWTPALSDMRALVQDTTGLTFNAVLVNLYRDGRDGMGWHADAEPEIGPSPEDRWVASLSLGASRRFVLRHPRRPRDRRELDLGRGGLLVMRGTTQRHYRHAIPKTTRPVEPRLNLTFRHIAKLGSSSPARRTTLRTDAVPR